MKDCEIFFPTLELTDWVFEGEGVLMVENTWTKTHHIKEDDFQKQYNRIIIDSKGQVLKVTGDKIVKKEKSLFAFFSPPTLVVEFDLIKTGRTMTIDEVKRNVISKSSKNYHITHNKIMTEEEYISKVREAKTYEELFTISGLVEY